MPDEVAADVAAQLMTWALTGALGLVAGWVARRLRSMQSAQDEHNRRRDAEMEALRAGMTCTLKADLVDIHRRYVVEGEPCPVSEKDRCEETYMAYHALGGNGTGTELYRQVMEDAKVAGRSEWRRSHGRQEG